MYNVEVTLKGNPMALFVQRKESEAAEALYQTIVSAITGGTVKSVELSCEKEEGKKITILASEITSVQISQKAGATTVTGVGFGRS